MGVVYEAFDRERQECVALKSLQRADGVWLARFKREFHALHDLSHPNLVALGELFERDSEAFFTMELVRGCDILSYARRQEGRRAAPRQSIDPFGATVASEVPAATFRAPVPRSVTPIPYDEARLRAAFSQLALALAALHHAGRVHRDLKPSNTMVTPNGRVVLLDFGLVTERSEALTPLSDFEIVGTVSYMAPEQAFGGDVGPAADWFGFGVMLFEALTGTLPHRGRTAFQVLLDKQRHTASPRQIVSDVPGDLDDLCSGLLQIQPGSRPQAREILDRLGVDAGDESSSTLTSSGAEPAGAAFVGRVDELQQLRVAFQRSRLQPLIFLVEGESGVGKSQLVEAFLRQLLDEEPDTVVLSGRCYEREVVSYKAFDGIADALARYLAKLSSVDAAVLMPLEPRLVARLFPVLKRVQAIAAALAVPDLPDPHQQRQRMFAGLRELFLRVAERQRLVWFIDDLQWADADSVVLLQELIAHEEQLAVFPFAYNAVTWRLNVTGRL